MRYIAGMLILTLQLLAYSGSTYAQTRMSPNAQTGSIPEITIGAPSWGWAIYDDESLVVEFDGLHISELSTLRIESNSWGSSDYGIWEGFTDYGVGKRGGGQGGQLVFATVTKTEIRLTSARSYGFHPLHITGIRCSVVPFTKGITPKTPPEVTLYIMRKSGIPQVLGRIPVAIFADPIDSQMKAGPEYTWSDGSWDLTATIGVSEAGAFSNSFETQSTGALEDATQLIVTLWGMPEGMVLRDAVVAATTSNSVVAAVSPTLAFPLSGSPVRIPIYILRQDDGNLEEIDIRLTLAAIGMAEKLPIGSVYATFTLGPQAPLDLEPPIPFDPVPGAGIGGNRYFENPEDPVSILYNIESPMPSLDLAVSAGGASSFNTTGAGPTIQAGYVTDNLTSGSAPYGTAVLSFKQNGVTVTEAGIPASPPTTRARIFIDYRSNILATPGRRESGTISVNTGIAAVNYGAETANVTYILRDHDGNILSTGHGTIAARNKFACFIDQLKDVAAPDFNLPSNFQFGSLEIAGDQTVSIVALRGTNNQRNDFLITTTPIADLTKPLGDSPIYFPEFVDGGGYTTSLILLNTSKAIERGTLKILDDNGAPMVVTQAGGTTGSTFRYSIPSGGSFRFQTDGAPADAKAGWMQIVPDLYTSTPIGSAVFGYNPEDILVSESGIPAAAATTHARAYVDLSNNHNTGLAIANVTNADAEISVNAFQTDGTTKAGTSQEPIPLLAKGHAAAFADQFITGLPEGFTGVLDISSATPFAALTLRSLLNERHDFLMTTFPIADANQAAPSPIVFPLIVDGGGYVTQFVLISAGQASSATHRFYDEHGAPLTAGK